MSEAAYRQLLDALLGAWDRDNEILVKLLRVIPEDGLDARAAEDSPSVAELFTHIHYVRLANIEENAPEFAVAVPEREWVADHDRDRVARMLDESARVVRNAVEGRLSAGRDLDRQFGHPINMLQLLVWHEGYHHGQIKLALKRAGKALSNKEAGPASWGVWMRRS